jgi:hypothetical protein
MYRRRERRLGRWRRANRRGRRRGRRGVHDRRRRRRRASRRGSRRGRRGVHDRRGRRGRRGRRASRRGRGSGRRRGRRRRGGRRVNRRGRRRGRRGVHDRRGRGKWWRSQSIPGRERDTPDPKHRQAQQGSGHVPSWRGPPAPDHRQSIPRTCRVRMPQRELVYDCDSDWRVLTSSQVLADRRRC